MHEPAAKRGTDFIPEKDRIATFDNDGTLWAEQPLYFQFFFMFDRIRKMAPAHPEWNTEEPFRSAIKGDIRAVFAGGEKSVGALMVATHTGMSESQFRETVRHWIDTAIHPVRKKRFTELVYQPMLELLNYLRAHGFKTFIVSGGEIDFMRAWVEDVHGIPPYQVVGTQFKVKYCRGQFGWRLPDVKIHEPGRRMALIVHHTGGAREWAYDRVSSIGRLAKGLDDAGKYGWVLVDMQKDWKVVFPGDVR